jgi:hypothetical protein
LERQAAPHKKRFLLTSVEDKNNTFEYVVGDEKDAAWDGTVESLDKAIIKRALEPDKDSRQSLKNWVEFARYPVYISGIDNEHRNVGPYKVEREIDFLPIVECLRRHSPSSSSIDFEARDDKGYGQIFRWTEGPLAEAAKPKNLKEWMAQVKTSSVTINCRSAASGQIFERTYSRDRPVGVILTQLHLVLSDVPLPVRVIASPSPTSSPDDDDDTFKCDITSLSTAHPCWAAIDPDLIVNKEEERPTTPMSQSVPKPETLEEWMAQVKAPNVRIRGTGKNGAEVFYRIYGSRAAASAIKGEVQEILRLGHKDNKLIYYPIRMVATSLTAVPAPDKGEAFEWDIPAPVCGNANLDPIVNKEPVTMSKDTPKTLEEWMAQVKAPKVTVEGLDKNDTKVFQRDYDSYMSGRRVRESLYVTLASDVSPLRLPVRLSARQVLRPGEENDWSGWGGSITDLSKDHSCWDIVAPLPPAPPKTPNPLTEALAKFKPAPAPAPETTEDQDDNSIEPGDLVVHTPSGTLGKVVQFVPDHEIQASTPGNPRDSRISLPAWAVDTRDGLRIYPEGSLEFADETDGPEGGRGQTAWAAMGFVAGVLATAISGLLATGALWR